MLLNYLDPLGTNEKVKEKIESVIPTMDSAGAAGEAREGGGKERVLSRKQEKAIQASMAQRNEELQKQQGQLLAGEGSTTSSFDTSSQTGASTIETGQLDARSAVLPVSQEHSPSTGFRWGWNAWFGKDSSTPLHHQSPASPLPPAPQESTSPTPTPTTGKGKTALDGLL